ncbi:MAG: glycosyltransferase family 39 protein [Dehalococcoidia bacterium]
MIFKLKTVPARLKAQAKLGHLAWVTVIFVVAVTARSLWVAHTHADPFADAQFYDRAAASLAEGKGYLNIFTQTATALWPPGYSFLLAAFYRVFGSHLSIAWGINIVLGALTCALLYVIGNLIGGRKVGVLAGLTLALLPGHVFYSSIVLSEVLFTFLAVAVMTLILWAVRKSAPGPPLLIVIGVLVGASALVRGQGLLLIFVAGLFWWLYTHDWARSLQWATVVMLTALAVIVPWSIRNYFAMKEFIFISTNDGVNLYMGNHEGASGGFEYGAGGSITEQFGYLPPNEQEAKSSNVMMREGLRFMFTHPIDELGLTWSKLRYLYQSDDDSLVWIEAPEAGKPLANRQLLADVLNDSYFAVLAFAGVGLYSFRRRLRGAVSLPLIFVGVFTLGQMPFFGMSRFHYPMLPSFALMAAAGMVSAVGYLRSRWKRLGAS